MVRISLFLLANLSIMFVFWIILGLMGIQKETMNGLVVIAGLFGFGGSFISLLISKWIALRSVRGEIIKTPRTEIEHWLLNVIKFQSDQVGVKMPEVAIYQAPNINAFATGFCRDASLIAVSTGLLALMDRNETEAVIAHEISHIINGDMVTMTLLQGVLNTFVILISRILSQIISLFLSTKNGDTKSEQKNPIICFIVSIFLEIIFGILANVIAMWFSRYREFRADAGSACLVGKEKMISALQRLKKSYEPQESPFVTAFCINGRTKSFTELFLSHPSLDRRIEALRVGTYLN